MENLCIERAFTDTLIYLNLGAKDHCCLLNIVFVFHIHLVWFLYCQLLSQPTTFIIQPSKKTYKFWISPVQCVFYIIARDQCKSFVWKIVKEKQENIMVFATINKMRNSLTFFSSYFHAEQKEKRKKKLRQTNSRLKDAPRKQHTNKITNNDVQTLQGERKQQRTKHDDPHLYLVNGILYFDSSKFK